MIEKRHYRRSPMTGWVEILEEGKSETLYGYVSNISPHGIGLYARKVLPLGTAVTLSVHFFGREGFETVKGLSGVVTWCFEQGMISTFGVRFEEPVTEEKYPALFKFLEDAIKRK